MRVLLQNGETGQFYVGGDAWTTDPDEAQDFRIGSSAIDHASRLKLVTARIYYAFRNSQENFSIPITGKQRRL